MACALVASSFYFDKNGSPISRSSSSTEVYGHIACRFDDGSDEMAQLGRFITSSSKPEFILYNEPKSFQDICFPIPYESMIGQRSWNEPQIRTNISGDDVISTIALRLPGICGGGGRVSHQRLSTPADEDGLWPPMIEWSTT